MTIDHRAERRARLLAWAHGLLFGVIALTCYISPETAFGDPAWIPLARLAVLLFAAALMATAIVLIGSARSGRLPQIKLALVAAVFIDAQIPILIFSQPGSLDYVDADLGIPWFVIPLSFIVIVGITVHCFVQLPRGSADSESEQTGPNDPISGSEQIG